MYLPDLTCIGRSNRLMQQGSGAQCLRIQPCEAGYLLAQLSIPVSPAYMPISHTQDLVQKPRR